MSAGLHTDGGKPDGPKFLMFPISLEDHVCLLKLTSRSLICGQSLRLCVAMPQVKQEYGVISEGKRRGSTRSDAGDAREVKELATDKEEGGLVSMVFD